MMNLFVTGGTGVLGRPVVRALVAQGHRTRVLAHTPHNERVIRELGGEPVHADLFDPASLKAALADSEAVLHLASRIPPSNKMGKAAAWADNDRLRTEGTRNLVDAALAGQVHTFIYPSVVLVYPDSGQAWIDAQTSQPRPIAFVCSTVEAEAQVRRFPEADRRGITLRMGNFYGPQSGHTQDTLAYARKGLAAVLGPSEAYQSSVWIDDAARAVVAALDRAPSGTYDVVDDEPLSRSELVPLIAHAAGQGAPVAPAWLRDEPAAGQGPGSHQQPQPARHKPRLPPGHRLGAAGPQRAPGLAAPGSDGVGRSRAQAAGERLRRRIALSTLTNRRTGLCARSSVTHSQKGAPKVCTPSCETISTIPPSSSRARRNWTNSRRCTTASRAPWARSW